MKALKKIMAIAVIASGIGLGSSCKKLEMAEPTLPHAKGTSELFVQDAAGAHYDEINLDIKGVEVFVSGENAGWHNMKTKSGMYNILSLKTAFELAEETDLPVGNITFMRVLTGENNSVKVHGETFKMKIMAERGLLITMPDGYTVRQHKVTPVTIDFNSANSVSLSADESSSPGYIFTPSVIVIGRTSPVPDTGDASTK